ncbi:MAG: alanine racemase [Clostridia bacterium]|nr:alanine racemase [Clostridia bacterium]
MYKEAIRPAWAEINLSNLEYNIKQIQAKIKDCGLIGIIKADAYGHGAIPVAQVLRENGCKTFAVATIPEAVELRKSGAKENIIVLGLSPDMYADTIVKYDITPVVCRSENAKAISDEAVKQGKTVEIMIIVDTGMGRIGYWADDIETALEDVSKIKAMPNIKIKGMLSHLSTADHKDKTYSYEQADKYKKFRAAFKEAGIELGFSTLANSASIMEIPEVHFDACRPGIILYGLYPSEEVDRSQLDLKPVMSVKANIVYLKEVDEGFSVGYGRKFISTKPTKIATLSLGYADGYPRPFSPHAEVIVNGVKAHLAGNICMDQCMVDVTDVPNVKLGDEVIIMGSDGVNSITAEDIANSTGTIVNEITCAFGQRLPKVYVK